jgi:small subunit ribosomal protein S9
MADEERQDQEPQADEAQDAPADEAPAEDAPAEEAPAEDAPAEDAPAEEAPAAEAPAEEAPGEDAAADEPAAEQTEPDPDAPGSEAEEATGGDSDSEKKAKDLPPGAELDPIALEPERELSAEERARLEAEEEERARLEAEAEAEDGEVPLAKAQVDIAADTRIQATGKRKSSVARVVVVPGSGTFEVNRRALEEFFPRHAHQVAARQPLVTAGYEGTVDVKVRVHGGGISGQAGAVRHGVARALVEIDPELRSELKRRGYLTRDAREKERRKAGLKKARKRPQFSKR